MSGWMKKKNTRKVNALLQNRSLSMYFAAWIHFFQLIVIYSFQFLIQLENPQFILYDKTCFSHLSKKNK